MVKEYIEAVIRGIVDEPDAVRVERKVDERGTLYVVDVGEKDRGAVIGRKGEVANAIRSLVRVVGGKEKERASVKLNF
jgi:hypothetical protein